MTRYAIFACDQMYGGLHGMNYTGVVEADSEKEIADLAMEEALYVIQSYADIYNALEEEIKEYLEENMTEEEEDEIRNDIYLDDVETTWALVDETKVKGMTTEEIDELCCNIGYSEFVEEYCIIE